MLKSLFFLVANRQRRAVPAAGGGNAPPPEDRQRVKCAEAVGWAQKALVVAVAQNRERRVQAEQFAARIAELEERVALARAAGNEDVASGAAETIASLEVMRDRVSRRLSGFEDEFARLRRMLRTARLELEQLRDGAVAVERNSAVWWRRDHTSSMPVDNSRDPSNEAETVLAHLHVRQAEIDQANAVLQDLDAPRDSAVIPRFMMDAGSGKPKQ